MYAYIYEDCVMEHHVNFSSVPLCVSFVDKILKNCRKL